MKECIYHVDINGFKKTFNSDRELTEFVKGNIIKSDGDVSVKLSLTINQSKTELLLKEMPKQSEDGISESEFLKQEHIVNGEKITLATYLSKENYEKNVLKAFKEDPSKFPEFANLSDEEILKMVKEDFELDNKMANVSKKISYILTILTNSPNLAYPALANHFDELFELIAKYNKEDVGIYREVNKKDVFNKFKTFISGLDAFGDLKGGVKLTDKKREVNSNLNILANDKDGKLNLFQYKVSRKPFSEWHSAKKTETDYSLAVKRQLLDSYVDMKSSSLFVVPIIIPELNSKLDIKSLTFDSMQDRSKENVLQMPGGSITTKIKAILPSVAHRQDIINNDIYELNKATIDAMFTGYEFKTQRTITNIESLYNKAVEFGKDKDYVFIYDYIRGNRSKIQEQKTPGWEERFKKKIEKYVAEYNENSNSKLNNLIKTIETAKRAKETNLKTSEYSKAVQLNFIFGKYLSDSWEMLSYPELLDFGVIVFRNYDTATIEAVSVTMNDLKIVYPMNKNKNIIGKYMTDRMVENDDKILQATGTNIETLKALAVLNNSPRLFDGGFTLSNVIVYNQLQDKGNFSDLTRCIYNFSKLIDKTNSHNNSFKDNFRRNKIKESNWYEVVYSELLTKSSSNVGLQKLIRTMGDMREDAQKLEWYEKLRDKMINTYRLSENDIRQIEDFSDPIKYAYYLVSMVISQYKNLNEAYDYENPKIGIKTNDLMHWIRSLTIGNAPDFNKDGTPVVGILQGSLFNTTDVLRSEGIRKLHDLISIKQNAITREYTIEANNIKNHTLEYYKSIGRSDLSTYVLGDAYKYHEKFIRKDAKNKLSNEFMFENPYSNDVSLTPSEKDYLKFILFQLYKQDNNSFKTIQEFESSEKFVDIISNDNDPYFQIPLIRRMDLSKAKMITTDQLHKTIGKYWSDFKVSLDPRDTTDEQRAYTYRSINGGFHKVTNAYTSGDLEFRNELLSKYGPDYFEINLDTIALKYTMESIKSKHMNSLLPDIHSALTVMKFHAWQTGETKEMQEALEDFWKQIQISIYDQSPLQGKESEQVIAALRKVQRVTSLMTIALRPALLIKELIVGTFKNVSYAWTKVYGDDSFEMKHLTKAYQILMMNGASFELQKEFNLIDAFNLDYRIVNMDLNNVVDKTKIDRRGFFFASKHLYWMNTAPDYTNRLTLFIAKMLKDGSYNAHSVDSNGNLKYDPAKDERFAEYMKYRNKYDFKYSTDKNSKYDAQRALYLAIMKEFNVERLITGEPPLKEQDLLPRAYTNRDRDSIKEFSDTAYGYYDHERSPLIKHTEFGIIFMQFLTYWPAKVKYYFGKPGGTTKRGHFAQKYELDENKNKVLQWLKIEYDEETGESYEVPTSENTGIPLVQWVNGSPAEGLLYSLGYTIKDLLKGDFNSTDPARKARAYLAFHDLMMGLLLMQIASLIIYGKLYTPGKKMTVAEGEEPLEYAAQYASKIAMNAMGEFDPFSSVFGALRWTPAAVSQMSSSITILENVISGDDDLSKFFRKSFKMLEVFPMEVK